MATFHCAIEMEPKTLKPGQLNYVKEIAIGVIHEVEPQEASNFCIQELRQGGPIDAMEQITGKSYDVNSCTTNILEESLHPCICDNLLIESPNNDHEAKPQQPLTAPF